jgi:hypothetical protein
LLRAGCIDATSIELVQTASWNRPTRIAGADPTGRRGGLLALLAAFVAVAVTVGPTQLMVATAYADADACAAQQSALNADNQAIAEHNGRLPPGGSAPSDVADPYNQEAAQLNAKGDADVAKLRACRAANSRLQDKGPVTKRLPDSVRNALDDARRNAPPGWRAPDPLLKNPRNQNVIVPTDSPARPVYDAVRRETPQRDFPSVALQGQSRPNVGDPSVATPGQTIAPKRDGGPGVSADHIVPLAEIVQLPRFMELNPDNMWGVVNAPLNLQWLDSRVNMAKGSKSVSALLGVDEAWRAGQLQLQNTKRQELIDIIAQLADSQID